MLELAKRVQLLGRWGKLGHPAPRMLLGTQAAPQGRGDPKSQHHLASEHQRDAKVVNPKRQQSGPVLQAHWIQDLFFFFFTKIGGHSTPCFTAR